jgi:hypothetical protein
MVKWFKTPQLHCGATGSIPVGVIINIHNTFNNIFPGADTYLPGILTRVPPSQTYISKEGKGYMPFDKYSRSA